MCHLNDLKDADTWEKRRAWYDKYVAMGAGLVHVPWGASDKDYSLAILNMEADIIRHVRCEVLHMGKQEWRPERGDPYPAKVAQVSLHVLGPDGIPGFVWDARREKA
jgi:hypothetical protein